MIIFMKKHTEKVLIIIGVILLALFTVYTQKNIIPTQNTCAYYTTIIATCQYFLSIAKIPATEGTRWPVAGILFDMHHGLHVV